MGVYGKDASGVPFVQVKQMKSGDVIVNVIITAGEARLQCRECLRWTGINIVNRDVVARPDRLPEGIQAELSKSA